MPGSNQRSKLDPIASFFLALILVGVPVNILSNRLYENSWTVGEWLINYAGGFVRRGLPGTAIYNLADFFKFSPTYLIWSSSLILYIALAWLIQSFCRGKLEASLLLSPIILLGPVLGNNLVRKDTLMLVAFGLCLHIIRLQIRNRARLGPASVILINLLSTIAILSHELYGFWALPSLILILSISTKRNLRILGTCLRNIAIMLPSIMIFICSLLFRGSPTQASQIHESWRRLLPTIRTLGTLWDASPPDGAIQSIGWSTSKALSLTLSSLLEFSSGLWIPAVWMLTIYVCLNLFTGRGNSSEQNFKRIVALYQLIAFLPLFIIGYDFGRWIFLWATSSALLYGFLALETGVVQMPSKQNRALQLVSRLIPGVDRRGHFNTVLMFLGIPRCCWTIAHYWHCTPIGYVSILIKDLKIFMSLGFLRAFTP